MADSNSPAFVPPINSVKDTDPMIMRVPLDKMDAMARPSSMPSMRTEGMTLATIPNKNAAG